MFNLIKKVLKYTLYVVLSLLAIYLFIAEVRGNFYQVDDGVYRSGKLNKYNLVYYLEKYEIKTVINLQGKTKKSWYPSEKEISKEHNVTHIDYKLSNSKYYDFNRTSAIVELLKNAEKPMLIHCVGGADRTSMVSALYEYAINNKSAKEAKEQMKWYYGYLPQFEFRKHVIAMGNSFDNYVKVKKQNDETAK